MRRTLSGSLTSLNRAWLALWERIWRAIMTEACTCDPYYGMQDGRCPVHNPEKEKHP